MNKTEKLICLFLGMALVWCFLSNRDSEPVQDAPAQSQSGNGSASETNLLENVSAPLTNAVGAVFAQATNDAAKVAVKSVRPAAPEMPKPEGREELVTISNKVLKLELTSWGASVKRATLNECPVNAGEIGEDNPAVVLDYTSSPLGALDGVKGIYANSAYGIKECSATSVVFTNAVAGIERTITLGENYNVVFEDRFTDPSLCADGNSVSMGVMTMGSAADDILSIDAKSNGEKGEVVYYGSDGESTLYPILAGGIAGGCGCGGPRQVNPADPETETRVVGGAQDWIALKDRFFVTAMVSSSQNNKGFQVDVSRQTDSPVYRPKDAKVKVLFPAGVETRKSEFYIGPKKLSFLADSGIKEVMEFGFWSFLCYPMVWVLNFFEDIIPNYGVAIILLTILVRIIFWPLTRKSTEGMKKMQEIQPLLKELQAKFKDNPQRLQQETWALYREKKVNPLSSCLPMLVQIPIFIALFNVLRSMVELRYASFLWIDDLSAPEHLFASTFPFGGLNILPILMAVTMYLQSRLTPSAGDKNQQRMMTVFMPIMMLFMFYNFASALSLYWTVSQVLSILQMWMMRREAARKAKVLEPEVIDPPSPTRQMRRPS